MPKQTSAIKIVEMYYNRSRLDPLIKADTENQESYPTDNDRFINTATQKQLKAMLSGSKKNRTSGVYCKTVSYEKKKYQQHRYGRLVASGGSIQHMWKFIRKLVFDDSVVGFDMTNSQPTIIQQLCQKHAPPSEKFNFLTAYCRNRDEIRRSVMDVYGCDADKVKNLFTRLCFGGTVRKWEEDHGLQSPPNKGSTAIIKGFENDVHAIMAGAPSWFPDFHIALECAGHIQKTTRSVQSAFALYLQNIEGDIMQVCYDTLVQNGFDVAAIIHDEICVKTAAIDFNTQELISILTQVVEKQHGFKVAFKIEDYTTSSEDLEQLQAHQKHERTGKHEPDDIRNGKILYELLSEKCHSSSKSGQYLYDDETGLWVHDEANMKRIVYRYASEFKQTKMDNSTREIIECFDRDFGSMYKNIVTYFWTLVPPSSEALNVENNRGFLLFNNGVLDCFEFKMLPFAPEYHFTKKINRDFDTTIDMKDTMDQVLDQIFKTAYSKGDGDFKKMDYFLETLAIAVCEGGVDKQMLTMLGETNSGKGVLTKLLHNAFDQFISTFNTSILIQGVNANLEDASKWRFLIDCHDTRIMIGNEIPIDSEDQTNGFGRRERREKPLNVDMIKTLVSGGDSVKARRLRENEITIQNHAFVMLLANDMPKTTGDKAFVNRQLIMYADRSSTTNEDFDQTEFFKADKNIKTWIDTPNVRDAFVGIVCDYYARFKYNRSPKPDWVTAAVEENIVSTSSWDWVKDNYDVYPGDCLAAFNGEEDGSFKKRFRFDWNKVGEYVVPFDMLYKLYKDAGGKDSSTKFARMLGEHHIYSAVRKQRGRLVACRVGLAIVKDDYKFSNDDL